MGPWKPNVKTSLANSVGIDLFQFQVASGTVMFRFKAQLVSVFYHEWHKASPTPFLFLASFPNICNTFLLPLYQSLFSFSKAPIWSASMQYGSKGDGYSGSSVKDDNIVSLFCRLFPSLAGEGGVQIWANRNQLSCYNKGDIVIWGVHIQLFHFRYDTDVAT